MGAMCCRSPENYVTSPSPGGTNRVDAVGSAPNWYDGTTVPRNSILKPTAGMHFGGARLRYGDILQHYGFCGRVLACHISGPVQLAFHRTTGRLYAVKSFCKTGASKDKITMIRNETLVNLRLDHPHIARLIEIWESNTHVHVILEYCSGGSLFDRLCLYGMFEENLVRQVASQILSAVNFLHTQNVVHRDLKLENWLYQDRSPGNFLKLSDFGFAKMFSSNSKTMHATCGTLAYVSPDALLGCYTNSCDLWSVGVIVYTLLVGYPPFFGTEETLFRQIIDANYSMKGPRWARISAEGIDFVRRLLQEDPQKRLTAKKALLHRWITNNQEPARPVLGATVVKSLLAYTQCSGFQRLCFSLLSYLVVSSQLEDVASIFLSLDVDSLGTISPDDLYQAICESGVVDLQGEEMLKIVKCLTRTEPARISFSEFIAAMFAQHLSADEHMLRQVFSTLGADDSGFISFYNVRNCASHLSLKRVSQLFAEADIDGNGLIDYSIFLRLVTERHSGRLGSTYLDPQRSQQGRASLPPTGDLQSPSNHAISANAGDSMSLHDSRSCDSGDEPPMAVVSGSSTARFAMSIELDSSSNGNVESPGAIGTDVTGLKVDHVQNSVEDLDVTLFTRQSSSKLSPLTSHQSSKSRVLNCSPSSKQSSNYLIPAPLPVL